MFLGPRIILHDNILDPVPQTFFFLNPAPSWIYMWGIKELV